MNPPKTGNKGTDKVTPKTPAATNGSIGSPLKQPSKKAEPKINNNGVAEKTETNLNSPIEKPRLTRATTGTTNQTQLSKRNS